ncbi:ankyrin repeat domain-containing protein [Jiella sonneratiae]|uniref:Ankyrin repeat domain-containing protein n=1 Tax=Jiella sonneratiae TaxID=2816856 RepID=A0ABS3J3T6_9HYPH|nr:ankyrin repeat domain-containing protein [Jiella sonneratiae]MBO0904336.1 ankyrin repeat domain-containing protein [Jiella sonneratiae]
MSELTPEEFAAFQEIATRVFNAARAGEAAELAAFLDAGIPVNLTNEKGDSLLMLASYHGHLDATRILLEKGADPERRNDRGQAPLAGAAFKGEMDIARLLLDHGAAVDGSGDDGRTALMTAAMFDRIAMVELFVERGADIEARAADGVTAEGAARAMGAAKAAERLGALRQDKTASPKERPAAGEA